MPHECHAIECGAEIAPKLLFCLKHWRMLSKKLKDLIWENYRPGQERDKKPSRAYLFYQRQAVNDVARREGKAPLEEFKSLEQAEAAAALFARLSPAQEPGLASPSVDTVQRSAGRLERGGVAQLSLFPIASSQEPAA